MQFESWIVSALDDLLLRALNSEGVLGQRGEGGGRKSHLKKHDLNRTNRKIVVRFFGPLFRPVYRFIMILLRRKEGAKGEEKDTNHLNKSPTTIYITLVVSCARVRLFSRTNSFILCGEVV